MKRECKVTFGLLISTFLVLVLVISCYQDENNKAKGVDSKNIDLFKIQSIFNSYFALFDSTVTGKYIGKQGYPIDKLQEGIEFMEDISGIESNADMTYFGRITVLKEDIDKWKKWYDQNRSKLKWDEKQQKVILSE